MDLSCYSTAENVARAEASVVAAAKDPQVLWALGWPVTYVEEGCIGDEKDAAEGPGHVLNAATLVRDKLLDPLNDAFGSFPYRPHVG